MGQLKNVLVIIASITVMIFVADKFWTKYNLDSTEPTCINDGVESLLLDLTTNELKKQMLKEGFVLTTRVLKENTTTEKRDITYKGKSKYSCNTSIEFGLAAIAGNKETEEIINQINLFPEESLAMTLDRDYKVNENDLGTTYFVRALRFTEDDLSPFTTQIMAAKYRIAERKSEKCSLLHQTVLENLDKYKTDRGDINILRMAIKDSEQIYKECNETEYEISSLEFTQIKEDFKNELKRHENLKNSVNESTQNTSQEPSVDTYKGYIGPNLLEVNQGVDTDIIEVSIEGNDETCRYQMDMTGGLVWTDCLKITNSKKDEILCTKKKTMCKTINELRKALGVSGY